MLAARAHVNAMHRDISPNVHIVDPDVNIMPVLEQTNIVISEKSSVLIEALLLTRPAVSVSDWKITDTCPSPFAVLQQAQHYGSVPFSDRFRSYLRKSVYTVKHLLGIKRPLKKALLEMLRSSAA